MSPARQGRRLFAARVVPAISVALLVVVVTPKAAMPTDAGTSIGSGIMYWAHPSPHRARRQ